MWNLPRYFCYDCIEFCHNINLHDKMVIHVSFGYCLKCNVFINGNKRHKRNCHYRGYKLN